MFFLNYVIDKEQKNELKKINNLKEFTSDLGEIVGRIQLSFNNQVEGILDEEIPNIEELLTIWFQRLNEVIIYCKMYKFAIMKVPDSYDIWLEFQVFNDTINVKQVRDAQKDIKCFVENKSIHTQEVFWEETIETEVFYQCIVNKTEEFLTEVQKINPILMESLTLREIKELVIRAKDIN